MGCAVNGLADQSALKTPLNSCNLLVKLPAPLLPVQRQESWCAPRSLEAFDFSTSLSGELFCLRTARWASSAPVSMVRVGSAELGQPCCSEPQKLDTC